MTPTEDWSRVYLVSSLLLLVSIWFYLTTKNKYSHWSSRGIAGPRPLPLIGNFLSYFLHTKSAIDCLWAKKYGKVYGVYLGSEPFLMVADAEVLKQILKDFDFFPNHSITKWVNRYEKDALIFLENQHWKRVRVAISPLFSSGRLKRMYKQLSSCAQDMVELFDEQLDSSGSANVNVKNLFSLYTLDAIASCGYGLKLERARGKFSQNATASRNQMLRNLAQVFDPSLLRASCPFLLPHFLLKAIGFNLTPEKALEPAIKIVTKIIEQRRGSGQRGSDLLQMLMDANIGDMETQAEDADDQTADGHQAENPISDYKANEMIKDIERNAAASDGATKLTDIEVIANAAFFLIAGLESTTSFLVHCAYALAFHSEIQEKLHKEVSQIASSDSSRQTHEFEYEKLTQLTYLDSVVSETLRMLSPAVATDRICSQDYYIEKYNLHLAKDSKILVSFHAIMSNPDYWPEPEKFDPTRFMPENRHKIVPGSYCPFGLGPRHCIGMRFSLTEAKLGLAKLLMKFQFQSAPNSKFPPESKGSPFIFNIKNPTVRVVRRNFSSE